MNKDWPYFIWTTALATGLLAKGSLVSVPFIALSAYFGRRLEQHLEEEEESGVR